MSTGRLLLPALVLAASACSSSGEDWPQLIGQSLYNVGHYFCSQSTHCATADDRPGDTDNRR